MNDYEVRSVGCNIRGYEQTCSALNIDLLKYPVIEMAPPEDVFKFHSEVVLAIDRVVISGGKSIAHCRGGIGRAGLLAACYLLFKQRLSAKEAIQLVRERRD